MYFFGIVKNSANSQWPLDSENNDMTAVTKKPQDARELKVHIAGEGDSLVQLTFFQKISGELACERVSKVKLSIDTPWQARHPLCVNRDKKNNSVLRIV